jgi:hypothetical protein
LLKKDVPFVWYDQAQQSFDDLKKALMLNPLLIPPSYGWDFLLYITTYESTIEMVLIQEYDAQEEHIIYYLSIGISGLDLR